MGSIHALKGKIAEEGRTEIDKKSVQLALHLWFKKYCMLNVPSTYVGALPPTSDYIIRNKGREAWFYYHRNGAKPLRERKLLLFPKLCGIILVADRR